MRSRYSAYALGDAGYVLATWHPSTRPAELDLDPARTWEGLHVLTTADGGWLDAQGTVGFRARWSERGVRGVLREVSRFARDGARWAYVGPEPGAQAP
jgi:SEC-C motif-containing protein